MEGNIKERNDNEWLHIKEETEESTERHTDSVLKLPSFFQIDSEWGRLEPLCTWELTAQKPEVLSTQAAPFPPRPRYTALRTASSRDLLWRRNGPHPWPPGEVTAPSLSFNLFSALPQ